MPEPPKPEFCVGWTGVDADGDKCKILDGDEEIWIGSVVCNGFMTSAMWHKDGTAFQAGASSVDLIANIPEPDIYYRLSDRPECINMTFNGLRAFHPNGDVEKVEVRAIE